MSKKSMAPGILSLIVSLLHPNDSHYSLHHALAKIEMADVPRTVGKRWIFVHFLFCPRIWFLCFLV